jgi:hypothetical protein
MPKTNRSVSLICSKSENAQRLNALFVTKARLCACIILWKYILYGITASSEVDKSGMNETIKKRLLSTKVLNEFTAPNFFTNAIANIGKYTMGVGFIRRADVKSSPLKRYLGEYSIQYVAASTKKIGIASI